MKKAKLPRALRTTAATGTYFEMGIRELGGKGETGADCVKNSACVRRAWRRRAGRHDW